MSKIELIIGNQAIEGWESFTIRRSLDRLCGDFSLTLTNQEDDVTNALKAGIPCSINIDEHKFISGYTFRRANSASGTSTSLSLSGRDKTSDLVDCASINKSSTWTNSTLKKIVTDICKPFDIFADIRINDYEFKSFSTETGESAFNAIQRACNERAVLSNTNRFGDLVIQIFDPPTKPDTIDSLIYGDNILTITEDIDLTDRFSEYFVRGQSSGNGKAWNFAQLEKVGRAFDFEINRYRPLVISSERKASSKSVIERAAWEAQLRAGGSFIYTVTVNGFFQRESESTLYDTTEIAEQGEENFGVFNSKNPWAIGDIVPLIVDKWDVDKLMVISDITYSLSNAGELTSMTLKDPLTYISKPTGKIGKNNGA